MNQLRFSLNAILTVAVLLCACLADARQPSSASSPAQELRNGTQKKTVEETVFCLTASSSTGLWDYKIVVKRLTTYPSGPYRVDFIQPPNRIVCSLRENSHFQTAEVLGTGCVAVVFVGGDGKAFTRAFRLEPARVAGVLGVGGLTPPDFVDGFMLNYTGRIIKGNCLLPTRAEIYEWDGKKFNLAATANYNDRFDALSRLSRTRAARNPDLPCCGVWIDCPSSKNPQSADGRTGQESTQP
jgi:hypothetical protein